MIALAEADAICDKWDTNKFGKRDEEAEPALWNNRVYTAPMLLDDPAVFYGAEGRLVSVEVGGWGWLAQ